MNTGSESLVPPREDAALSSRLWLHLSVTLEVVNGLLGSGSETCSSARDRMKARLVRRGASTKNRGS